jgi:hypothetical protein
MADAQKAAATNDAEVTQHRIRLAQDQQVELNANAARAHQAGEAGLAKIQGARDEMARIDTSIDQNRFWASRSTGQKIAAVIGLALGAIGTGPDGINRAASLLDSSIARDIDAQKTEHTFRLQKGQAAIDSATSMYALNHQLTGDDVAATAASHAAAWGLVENKALLEKAKTAAPMAQAGADKLIAIAGQKKAEYDDVAKNRVGELAIKQQNANTESFKARTEREALGLKAKEAPFVSPGYELTPGAKPRPEELSDWRKSLATKTAISSQVATLKNLIDKNGTMLVGTNSAQASSIVNDIKSNLKEMEKLGALSGSDYTLLEAQIPDPTSWGSLGTKNASMSARLAQLTANIDAKFDATTKSIGVRPEGGQQNTEAKAWAAANPGDPRAAAILKALGGG